MQPEHFDKDDTLTQLLVQRAVAGQLGRFNALCERTLPALRAWVSLKLRVGLRDKLEVDEIVDETWARAVEHLESYDETRASFRAWLCGVAKNVLLERVRDLRRDRGEGSSLLRALPAEVTSFTRAAAQDDAIEHFLERVSELGPKERELVTLFGLEGLTAAQAALRLGIHAEAAQKRWSRLRALLLERGFARRMLLDE